MAPSRDVHDKDDMTDDEMRSGLKPFVVQRRKEKTDLPSTVAQLMPNKPFDAAFLSLRLTVFRVHSKSASPLARIMYDELGMGASGLDGLCELLDSLCPPMASEQQRNAWLAQSEAIKLQWPPYAEFYGKIIEARKILSIRLRDAGLRDVEVAYAGHEATVLKFKKDQFSIEKAGGWIYHYYPLDRKTRTMWMSVIMDAEILKENIYPAKRLSGGYITYSDNTPQATAAVPSTPEFKGCMFPYLSPRIPVRELTASIEIAPKVRNGYTDEAIAGTCDKRSRSDSIQAIRDTEQQPWNVYTSHMRPGTLQPNWSPNDVPFRQDVVSDNNAFWVKDLKIRRALIDDWNRATYVETVDENGKPKWVCRTTNKPPDEAIPNVDYPLVPEMCGTYTADRNPQWYEANVKRAQVKEDKEARIEAEPLYQRHTAQSKRHEKYVEFHVAQSRMGHNRYDSRYHGTVKKMMGTQIALDNRIKNEKGLISLLREAAGVFPSGVGKGLDGKSTPPALPSPPSPTKPQPDTSDNDDSSAHPSPIKEVPVQQTIKFAETQTTERESKLVVPSHQRPAKEDIVPFPRYKEPVLDNPAVGEEQLAESTNNKRAIEKLKEEAKLRKAMGKSITNILEETGIRKERSLSSRPTPAETADESPEPSPVTPSDLLGTVSRVKVAVTPSDLLGDGGGAIEEGEVKAKLLYTNLPVIVEEDVDNEDAA